MVASSAILKLHANTAVTVILLSIADMTADVRYKRRDGKLLCQCSKDFQVRRFCVHDRSPQLPAGVAVSLTPRTSGGQLTWKELLAAIKLAEQVRRTSIKAGFVLTVVAYSQYAVLCIRYLRLYVDTLWALQSYEAEDPNYQSIHFQ